MIHKHSSDFISLIKIATFFTSCHMTWGLITLLFLSQTLIHCPKRPILSVLTLRFRIISPFNVLWQHETFKIFLSSCLWPWGWWPLGLWHNPCSTKWNIQNLSFLLFMVWGVGTTWSLAQIPFDSFPSR